MEEQVQTIELLEEELNERDERLAELENGFLFFLFFFPFCFLPPLFSRVISDVKKRLGASVTTSDHFFFEIKFIF